MMYHQGASPSFYRNLAEDAHLILKNYQSYEHNPISDEEKELFKQV